MKKYLSLTLIAAVGLLIGTLSYFKKNNSQVIEESGTAPGYFEQLLEMKKNENGVIPRSAWKSWMEYDRLSKKNGSGIFSEVKEIGPNNIGGRTRAIVIDRENQNRIYAGGVSGGVWLSTNNGSNWTQVDDYAPTLSVTSIIQSPFDVNVLYYATGEAMGNSTALPGMGIFKSTDRGVTFQHLDASDTSIFSYIWRLDHSRTMENTIYVGTRDAGLFRSTDGGETFEVIHKTTSEIRDIEAFNDSTVWYTLRGYGIYKYDERTGETTKMGNGLPTSNMSYIDVDFCESQPNVAYAVIIDATRNALNGIYKTTNSGDTWTQTTKPTNISFFQGWYDLVIEVDPDNPNFVFVGAQFAGYSSNGGNSWVALANSHADYHYVAFYPGSNKYLVGNDGGLYSYDQSSSQSSYINLNNNYNVTQYYAGYYLPEGDNVIGGTQDNGTNLNRNGSPIGVSILGGDGAFCAIDQVNGTVYASMQNAALRRKIDINSGGWSNIGYGLSTVIPNSNDIWFINPFELNPVDGQQVYVITKNNLIRTTNAGNSWALASDRFVGNGFALGITKEDDPTIYVGGSAGVLYRLKNAKTATKEDMVPLYYGSPNGAKGSFIGNVEINPRNESSLYLGMTNYSLNPRIWKVLNADKETQEWVDISSNLPKNLPVNWIEVDPNDSNVIIIGTDNGLFTTTNGGGWWEKDLTIPNVKVNMIRLRESDRRLFVYTHGRGIWVAQLKENDQIAGVQNRTNQVTMTVYPNPTSDVLRFDGMRVNNYSVLAFDGKTVLTGTGNVADVKNLPAGTYFIRVYGEEGEAIQKFKKL